MEAIARPGHDLHMRKMFAHQFGGAQRRLHVVDRQHENLGVPQLGRVQQIEVGRVAVKHLEPEPAHRFHLLGIHIQRREAGSPRQQQATDDLADPPETGDHHFAGLRRHFVEGARWLLRRVGPDQKIADQQQQRRHRHRQRHHQRQLVGLHLAEHPERLGRIEQHKREFAPLGQGQRQHAGFGLHAAEQPAQAVEREELDRHESGGEPENLQRKFHQQTQVGGHPHRHEEQTEKQALKGRDRRLQLVTELGIGQQHPGDEGTEGHGQPAGLHQKRQPQHRHQRRGGEHLAAIDPRHVAEQGIQ